MLNLFWPYLAVFPPFLIVRSSSVVLHLLLLVESHILFPSLPFIFHPSSCYFISAFICGFCNFLCYFFVTHFLFLFTLKPPSRECAACLVFFFFFFIPPGTLCLTLPHHLPFHRRFCFSYVLSHTRKVSCPLPARFPTEPIWLSSCGFCVPLNIHRFSSQQSLPTHFVSNPRSLQESFDSVRPSSLSPVFLVLSNVFILRSFFSSSFTSFFSYVIWFFPFRINWVVKRLGSLLP